MAWGYLARMLVGQAPERQPNTLQVAANEGCS